MKLNVATIRGLSPNFRVVLEETATLKMQSLFRYNGTQSYFPVPYGSSANRPITNEVGNLRFNTEKSILEFSIGNGEWSNSGIPLEINQNGLQFAFLANDYQTAGTLWYDVGPNNTNDLDVGTASAPAYVAETNSLPGYFNFDGSDVIQGDSTHYNRINTSAGTVCAWVRFDTIGTNRVVVSYGGNNTNKGFLLQNENNDQRKIGFVTFGNATGRSQAYIGVDASTPFVNQWMFLVGAYNLTNTKVYTNSILRKNEENSGGSEALQTQSNFWIGNEPGRNYQLDGGVGAVLYYNRELSHQEIVNLYNNTGQYLGYLEEGQGASEPITDLVGPALPVLNGLQLYLDINEASSYSGSGTTWNDISGNSRNFSWNSNPGTGTDGAIKYFTTSGNLCVGPDSNTFGITNDTGFTIIHISNQQSNNSSHSFKFFGGPDPTNTNSSSRGIAPHATWSNGRIYFDIGGCCDSSQRLEQDPPATHNGSWRLNGFRLDKSAPRRDIFINNSSIANRTEAPANLNLTNRPVHLGGSEEYGNTSSAWDAWLSVFIVYNRPLSDSEMTQLYNYFNPTYSFS